jgi:hypothetical protein
MDLACKNCAWQQLDRIRDRLPRRFQPLNKKVVNPKRRWPSITGKTYNSQVNYIGVKRPHKKVGLPI